MEDATIKFPAYRSEEWIEKNRRIIAPKQFMYNVEITPKFMARAIKLDSNRVKIQLVREDIRNSLFKHSLMQIQNVEVISNRYCKEDRILKKIRSINNRLNFGRLYNKIWDREVLEKEIWEIDRCGRTIAYRVTIYREGEDGFSSRIWPNSICGLYEMIKFYYL